MSFYTSRKNKKLKQVYSPSIPTAPAPNYIQQKGRVIQQTPRNMLNPPTEMISYEDLQKMYNKLIRYKFPMPYYQQNFSFQFRTTLQDFLIKYPLNTMNPEIFRDFCDEIIQRDNPQLFGSKKFRYKLMSFQIANLSNEPWSTSWRFYIYLETNYCPDQLALVQFHNNTKDIAPQQISSLINISTTGPVDLENNIFRIYGRYATRSDSSDTGYITSEGYSKENATLNLFLPRIPLIVTNVGPDNLYYSSIVFNQTAAGDTYPPLTIFLYVEAEPI